MSAPTSSPRLVSRSTVVAVASHPSLWPTVLVQARRLVPRGWWRHWPPRITPTPEYVAFRVVTQHGSPDSVLAPAELVAYLRWCRDWNRYEST